MAVKGGKLLEEQLGRRPCARFKTQIEQGYNKVQRRAKRIKTVRFATPKQNGIAGTDRAFEGQLVVAPSAPELPASEGRKASRPVGRDQVAF